MYHEYWINFVSSQYASPVRESERQTTEGPLTLTGKVKVFLSVVIALGSNTALLAQTTTYYSAWNIDQRAGWVSCDVCAWPGGAGVATDHAMLQKVASPMLEGYSSQFNLKPSASYATALWWNDVGGRDASSRFIYDLYFYVVDPTAPQALEFDVNQTRAADSTKYIFGVECDIRGTHSWRYYDNAVKKWVSSGIACTTPAAYTWNHLVLEFQRVSATDTTAASLQWLAVTLNGAKSYLNGSSAPRPGTGTYPHINVAFQMDANKAATPYSVWIDKMKLTHW